MGFGMFSVSHSPIAIDFGSTSAKLLQVGAVSESERPPLLAAAEIPIPDGIRTDAEALFAHYTERLPNVLRDGRFKGRRVVITVPAAQTFTQHIQLNENGGNASASKTEVQALVAERLGCLPQELVVRSIDIADPQGSSPSSGGGTATALRQEVICFAIPRELVMRYVDLLTRCKLEVVGVHTGTLAVLRAFDHIHRRAGDEKVTTLYIDLGWSGTRVAVAHGKQLAFARQILIGGRHFDQVIASAVRCDLPSARAHRLAIKSVVAPAASAAAASPDASEPDLAGGVQERRGGNLPRVLQHTIRPGDPNDDSRPAVNVDLTELVESLTDEIKMCLRYHRQMFRDRRIDRAIFVGGEARQAWLCQQMVRMLRLPAQLGDPLARLEMSKASIVGNMEFGQPLPGWTVACGLCAAGNGSEL